MKQLFELDIENMIWSGITLLVGVFITVWACRILRSPTHLRKDSFTYRWLHSATWKWTTVEPSNRPQELSHRQIRFWALMALLTGAIMLAFRQSVRQRATARVNQVP